MLKVAKMEPIHFISMMVFIVGDVLLSQRRLRTVRLCIRLLSVGVVRQWIGDLQNPILSGEGSYFVSVF